MRSIIIFAFGAPSALCSMALGPCSIVFAQHVEPEQVTLERQSPNRLVQLPRLQSDIELQQAGMADRVPTAQISDRSGSIPRADQLTRVSDSAAPANQLYRGGRTAQPPAALSYPQEGRTLLVSRVEGADSCDPHHQRRSTFACEYAIESRAAEFAQPDPTLLSAEQRLLAEQNMRETGSMQAAARRLASNSGDANSFDDQRIAAIVLRDLPLPPAARPAEEPVQDDLTPADALVAAIAARAPQD